MSTGQDVQAAATTDEGHKPNLYSFVNAQLRSRFVPGGGTEQVYQVTAQTIASGIYYFHNFRPAVYAKPAEVVPVLNSLAGSLDTWSTEPGVTGISAVQIIDGQDQFVNMLDVTVSSTSGQSTTLIRVPYPLLDSAHPGTASFVDAVNKARAGLDAVESA